MSLVFVTPYLDDRYQKNRLNKIRADFDEIFYASIEDKPSKFAIIYRNRAMVEMSDIVICYVSRKWGGAYKTYCHAVKKEKQIINLASING